MTVANGESTAPASRISFRQARVFLAVADCRCITQAAKALNRSQTCVTKSLRDLEDQLGETLFDRSSKGVTLTAFGECLIRKKPTHYRNCGPISLNKHGPKIPICLC